MEQATEKRPVGRPKGSSGKGAKGQRVDGNGNKFKVTMNGDLVADLRTALRMSQEELAKRCYLTQPQISSIERGGVTCGFDAAYFIAKALKRPMEDFVLIQDVEG